MRYRVRYKEFLRWCNDRAYDGCWGSTTAIICINIINDIQSLPFWKRERKWKTISKDVLNEIVFPTNQKIEQWKRERRDNQ